MTDIPTDTDGTPDLQKLVQSVGGWEKITPEMWTSFDHAMMRAMSAHRFGDKYAKTLTPGGKRG
jgi:hypothetical protein